jgi:hypothetical protein
LASQTEIANDALILLGTDTISAVSDNLNQARAINAVWNLERDNELRAHVWKFSITRAALGAVESAPASGPYTSQFQLPAQCLRVLMVGDSFPGADLSDYRSGPPNQDYAIEGGKVLTNLPAPLSIRYVQQVTDPGLFDAAFAKMLACRIAKAVCFRLTNSTEMIKGVMEEYRAALSDAMRANALETPPAMPADDTWINTRLGDGGTLAIVNF